MTRILESYSYWVLTTPEKDLYLEFNYPGHDYQGDYLFVTINPRMATKFPSEENLKEFQDLWKKELDQRGLTLRVMHTELLVENKGDVMYEVS